MKQNYHTHISASASAQEVFQKISNVSDWWAKDFEGKSHVVGDVFTVRFQGGDRYTCKVSEIIPNKKIVWDVIDSYQGWHDDHTEWTGTKIVWEVIPQDEKTELKMTHIGLVPEFECFEACNQGWNYLIQKSLQKLLDTNEGMAV